MVTKVKSKLKERGFKNATSDKHNMTAAMQKMKNRVR